MTDVITARANKTHNF